jgi:hypothetical protein
MKTALGVVLLIVGLLGHVLAAQAIGGSQLAYQHHIAGFFLILVVTGVFIWGLGRLFWKGRRDITVLVIGTVQALFGIAIYLMRFHV